MKRPTYKLTPEELKLVGTYVAVMFSTTFLNQYPAARLICRRIQDWDRLRRLQYFYHVEQLVLDEKAAPWMLDLHAQASFLRLTS